MHDERQHTIRELAEIFSVGRSTVYRTLNRATVTSDPVQQAAPA